MADSGSLMQRSYKMLRVIYFIFFVHILFVIWMALTIPKESKLPLDRIFVTVIALVAGGTLAACLKIRRTLMTTAEAALKLNPEDKVASGKWRVAGLLGCCGAEAVALFGLVLSFVGGSKVVSGVFWLVAIAAMIAIRPRILYGAPFESGPISRNS